MFSKILFKTQDKLSFIYDNSLFLRNIDYIILLTILAVFVVSTFMPSDYIGYLAFTTIFLTFVKLLTKRGEKISFNLFELFLLAYFMIVIISLAGSTLFALSFKGFIKTFIYIGFYFSIANYLKKNTDKLPVILSVIAICLGFEGISALIQNFGHIEAISTWQDITNLNPEQVMTRVYGTLKPYNPNLLGGYFVVGIPATLGITAWNFAKKKYMNAIIAALISGISTVGLFLTGCRGAYIAIVAIFAGIFLISAKFLWQKYKKLYLSFIASITGIFITALIFITSLRTRFFSIFAMRNDSSNSFRFNVYQSSLKMFYDNWLLGIGVGNKNFREIYGLYMKTGFDALSAYNIYLETAVESGIFALIAFVGFLFVCLKDGIKFILNSDNIEKVIFVSVAVLSITAVMIHGFVDTIFFRPQVQFIFWTMVAIISTVCNAKLNSDI